MAQEKIYKIKVEGTEKVITNIEELETSVKQLEEKLKTTDIGTPEFKALQNEVKKARGTLKDFELQIEGLDKEQRATALVDTFNGLTGAVGAVGSAFLAFGAQSETIENVERKLLGVIGVVSGLRDASNGLVATQKLLGNVNLKEVATSFATTAKVGMKSLLTLKGGVRSLIGATGIGLLLVALGAVYENWERITEAIGLGESEQEKFVATATQNVEVQQQALDAISGQENILKLAGKSEREILQLKIQQTDEVIGALETQLVAQEELKKQQIATAERNKSILAGILRFLNAPIEILLRTIDGVGKVLGQNFGLAEGYVKTIDSVANIAFNPDKVEEEGDATIAETQKQLDKLKNQRAGYQLQVNAIDQKAGEERTAQREKEAQEAEDLAKRQAEAEKNAQQSLNEALRELALKRLNDKKEIAKQEYDNQLAVLEEQRLAELSNLELTEQAKADIEAKYRAQKESAELDYNTRLAEIQKEADDKAEEDRQKELNDAIALNDAKFALTSQSLGAINGLLDAFKTEDESRNKKIFEAQKKFSIAQAILDTYSAVQSIFANASANPATILFPAQPYIQAGIALANGLANVKKIQSTQFQSSSAGGGGGGTPAGVNSMSMNGTASRSLGAPNLNIPSQQQGGTTQQAGTQAGGGTPVIKTYVLAGDVSSAQDAEAKINQRRTL